MIDPLATAPPSQLHPARKTSPSVPFANRLLSSQCAKKISQALAQKNQTSSHPAPVCTFAASNWMMSKVVCECGKTVKGESALAQHKRDSPRHQQSVEPAGSNDPTAVRGLASHVLDKSFRYKHNSSLLTITILEPPSNSSPMAFSSRYPPIQFLRAGELIRDNGRKGKGRTRTKKTGSGTGSELPQVRFTEYGKMYVSGLGDEDWSLCDKDCGWCGHCADGVLFWQCVNGSKKGILVFGFMSVCQRAVPRYCTTSWNSSVCSEFDPCRIFPPDDRCTPVFLQ